MSENLLASATRLWQEAAPELDPSKAVALEAEVDSSERERLSKSLKKVSKWMDHAITKLGACAAVADEKDRQGLEPVASEVIKAFIAAIGTMISLRRGAGACLCSELLKVGQELASTLQRLGASIGTPSMAVTAGEALDCAQRLEHVSAHNRIAIQKRLQAILAQLRDGHLDLKDALDQDDNENIGICDADEAFNDPLDAAETRIAEATNATVVLVQELLEKAANSCGGTSPREGMDLMPVRVLEIVVIHGAVAVDAIDALIADVIGGLDQEEFAQSLEKLIAAVAGFGGTGLETQGIEQSLKDVRTALANIGGE